MKKNFLVLAFIAVLTFLMLPAENSVSAQRGRGHGRGRDDQSRNYDHYGRDDNGKHKGNWRKKNSWGYRNYGQYRRTQVGNRRYRYVRRYYWNDGTRLSRLVRIPF